MRNMSSYSGFALSLSTHISTSTEGGKALGVWHLAASTLGVIFVVMSVLAVITTIIAFRINERSQNAGAVSIDPDRRSAIAVVFGCLSMVGVAACLAVLLVTWWTEHGWSNDPGDGGVVWGSIAAILVYVLGLILVCEAFFKAKAHRLTPLKP